MKVTTLSGDNILLKKKKLRYIDVGSLFGKFAFPELQLPLSEMLFFTSRSGNGIARFSTVRFFSFFNVFQ